MKIRPANPWIPVDPDGLPPWTYPAWRRAEIARRAEQNQTGRQS